MTDQILKPEKEIREGEVIVGIAETPEQKIGRLKVVTERYKHEGYLEDIGVSYSELSGEEIVGDDGFILLEQTLPKELFDEFIKNGLLLVSKEGDQLYIDKYHWQSIQFVAETKEGYVGSVRLILNSEQTDNPVFPLPTLKDPDIVIEEEWKPRVANVKAELSQFAKQEHSHPGVAVALLRAASLYSKANNIEEWVATTDNRVVKMLNGVYFNFNLPKMGPSVRYMGSLCTPIYIDIERALCSAESYESSLDTAKFIRGEDIKGFGWYTGV